MKCFYHGCDFDGQCSAAIVKQEYPDCELIPINYGDKFPWESIEQGEEVFMVDFTIQPYDDMWKLMRMCSLTWIDHHKTSLDWAFESKFNPDCQGLRSIDFAGCELTWMYLHGPRMDDGTKPMPLAVKLLGRYDVWNHKDPRTLPFQYGMKSEAAPPANENWWYGLFNDEKEVDEIIAIGKICQKYQEGGFAATCTSAGFDLDWEGLKWTAINGPYRGSAVHKARFDKTKYDAMLGFWWDGKKWTFSLTTDKLGVDVSGIAAKYGGGGHKQAAGFERSELPFQLRQMRSREEIIAALAKTCLK